MAARKTTKATKKAVARKRQTIGESIIQGLNEAIAWTSGESTNVRVTVLDDQGPFRYGSSHS
jgi:hypothetical protein